MKCRVCKKITDNFYGKRKTCRDCQNKWAREYGKRGDVKERRNKKGNKWEESNIKNWGEYIPQKTYCEVCGDSIYFNIRNANKSIHFDHKTDCCSIKGSPKQWLRKHPFTIENKIIWDECDFGMLCGKCNRSLPTINRINWLKKVNKYVLGSE